MKYSREFLVGITVIVAVILFAAGIRYFQDLPFFGGGYMLETTFENSSGLVAGSPVRINGVSAGTVRSVDLRTNRDDVLVRFEMHGDVLVPEGSWVRVSGMELLGNVHLEVVLEAGSQMISTGSHVPSREQAGVMETMDRAPVLVAQTDSLLASSRSLVEDLTRIVHEQGSLLDETMRSVRSTSDGLQRMITVNNEALSSLIHSAAAVTADINRFTDENTDSLKAGIDRFNQTLLLLNLRLEQLGKTTAGIDELVEGIRAGDGTLGLLANDAALYHRLDSTLANLNNLLLELERNPDRFLKELRLIDLF